MFLQNNWLSAIAWSAWNASVAGSMVEQLCLSILSKFGHGILKMTPSTHVIISEGDLLQPVKTIK
jgi:hypothetical protein